MSRTMLRKAKRAKSSPCGNSDRSHEKFKKACLNHGILATNNEHDNGVDFVTYSYNPQTKEKVFKTVQVTKASLQYRKTKDNQFTITKLLNQISDEIDIVAILVEFDPDDLDKKNINSGISGAQDFWFLIPIDVYCHKKMYKHYLNTRVSWYLNVNNKFQPPLDCAYNAWYLFDNDDLEPETNRFLNIKPRKRKKK